MQPALRRMQSLNCFDRHVDLASQQARPHLGRCGSHERKYVVSGLLRSLEDSEHPTLLICDDPMFSQVMAVASLATGYAESTASTLHKILTTKGKGPRPSTVSRSCDLRKGRAECSVRFCCLTGHRCLIAARCHRMSVLCLRRTSIGERTMLSSSFISWIDTSWLHASISWPFRTAYRCKNENISHVIYTLCRSCACRAIAPGRLTKALHASR